MSSQFIIYACPVGELAEQLEVYFDQSLKICGPNAAHSYMPHCTLTGFFRDEENAIPLYQRAIAQALEQFIPPPHPVINISGMTFQPDWHGLELQSDWLTQLISEVAQLATSPTRQEPLRLKNWLHLSLAYGFPPEQTKELIQLAETYVNPQANVEWELRFYQRHADDSNHDWTCHQSWSLRVGDRLQTHF